MEEQCDADFGAVQQSDHNVFTFGIPARLRNYTIIRLICCPYFESANNQASLKHRMCEGFCLRSQRALCGVKLKRISISVKWCCLKLKCVMRFVGIFHSSNSLQTTISHRFLSIFLGRSVPCALPFER